MNVATIMMLAQQSTPGPKQPPPSTAWFLPALMLAMVAFFLLTSRSQRKREKQKRIDMYDRMGKNDRVVTIGGIYGTVITVKNDEVVLKVDESTNTKMTFLKSAIQRIVTDDDGDTGTELARK